MPVARAGMFGAPAGPDPTRPGAVRLWLVAAVALIIGIVIGFASGFSAAGRVNAPAGVASAPEIPAESPASGRPFSEATVPPALPALSEPARRVDGAPVRVDPEPVVQAAEPEVQKTASASPAPPAPPAPSEPAGRVDGPGSMQFVSRPSGAQVILDGRSVGRTPLALAAVPDGLHAVRFELPGFKPWSTTVEVRPGARARVAASLEQ